jgi:hypothetical protein
MKPPKQEQYKTESTCQMRTRLIHGIGRSTRWDYDHHLLPPVR